jgi:hypothetical protein
VWTSFSYTAAGQPRNHTGFPFSPGRSPGTNTGATIGSDFGSVNPPSRDTLRRSARSRPRRPPYTRSRVSCDRNRKRGRRSSYTSRGASRICHHDRCDRNRDRTSNTGRPRIDRARHAYRTLVLLRVTPPAFRRARKRRSLPAPGRRETHFRREERRSGSTNLRPARKWCPEARRQAPRSLPSPAARRREPRRPA